MDFGVWNSFFYEEKYILENNEAIPFCEQKHLEHRIHSIFWIKTF